MRRARRTPPATLVAAVLAVLVTALVPLAVGVLIDRDAPSPGPPGAVLDGADRRAVAAVPVQRGVAAPPVDPAVDLADPQAVARAYLVGARSARPDDGGRTRLQAAAYAVPGSPPATVGVLVLDPPPPGQVRTAAVTALALLATDEAYRRRGYRATVTTTTGPPATAEPTSGPPTTEQPTAEPTAGPMTTAPPGGTGAPKGGAVATTTAYVVLARQPDGHWLVTTDTPDVPEGDD